MAEAHDEHVVSETSIPQGTREPGLAQSPESQREAARMRRCELRWFSAVLTSQRAGATRRGGRWQTGAEGPPGRGWQHKLPRHSAPPRGRGVGARALIWRRSSLGGGQTQGVGCSGHRGRLCILLCVRPCFSGQEKVGP